jgi:tripartite ATP-independent transporter DctM subunit
VAGEAGGVDEIVRAEVGGDAREVAPRGRRLVDLIDSVLGWCVEIPAALLVVAEFGILLAGVLARYALHRPLFWSDELATTLFLWLSMFGAAVALRRGEHMRLTAALRRASPATRAWVDALAQVVVVAFVLEMLRPSLAFARAQAAVTLPALQIPASTGFAAIAVGMLLMVAIALVRLAGTSSLRAAGSAAFLAVAAAAGADAARPAFAHLGTGNLLVFFVGLVGVLVLLGVPIAFTFGVATVSYLALTTTIPLTVVVGRMAEGTSALVLLAVPLFVLLGFLIEMAGITRALIDFIAAAIGHLRGGLGYVLLGAMYIVSGISGSKAADMAAVAPVLFPEMRRRGWHGGELVGLLSASGAMGETIPPSLVLIIIGSVTGVSIAALFTGGLLPAAVAALGLSLIVFLRSRRDTPGGPGRPSWGELLRVAARALPGLALPVLVLGAVLGGIATATEASTVGIAYAVLVGLGVYRTLEWRRLYPALVETASLSGAILLIIGTATSMAWALTQSGFSQTLARAMAGVPGGQAGFLAVSIVVFIVLGSVLEGIPAVVLFGPLLFPVARALGIHEVHYAIVAVMAMGVGLFAPPLGVGFYAACAIGRVSPDDAMGRVFPYIAAVLASLAVVAASPWLSVGFLRAR